jgi:hypothetical protein
MPTPDSPARSQAQASKAPKAKRTVGVKHSLPSDFALTPDLIQFLKDEKWSEEDMAWVLKSFKNWAAAKDEKYINWNATFKNHVLRVPAWQRPSNSRGGSHKSASGFNSAQRVEEVRRHNAQIHEQVLDEPNNASNSTSNSAPINPAMAGLLEIMASRRYEMAPLEKRAWQNIIDSVSVDRFIGFLSHHMLTSSFAPTPADAAKVLDLGINSDVALNRLESKIKEFGPYRNPLMTDAVMAWTIEYLGGWATVNAEFPAQSDHFGMKAYKERFAAAFSQAIASARIDKLVPPATGSSALVTYSKAALLAPPTISHPSHPAMERLQ